MSSSLLGLKIGPQPTGSLGNSRVTGGLIRPWMTIYLFVVYLKSKTNFGPATQFAYIKQGKMCFSADHHKVQYSFVLIKFFTVTTTKSIADAYRIGDTKKTTTLNRYRFAIHLKHAKSIPIQKYSTILNPALLREPNRTGLLYWLTSVRIRIFGWLKQGFGFFGLRSLGG